IQIFKKISLVSGKKFPEPQWPLATSCKFAFLTCGPATTFQNEGPDPKNFGCYDAIPMVILVALSSLPPLFLHSPSTLRPLSVHSPSLKPSQIRLKNQVIAIGCWLLRLKSTRHWTFVAM